MPTRYTVACEEDQARSVERLAHRYGISQKDVIRQLIDLGLDSIEETV